MNFEIIEPSIECITPDEMFPHLLEVCEVAARTCYRSETKLGSDPRFLRRIMRKGHESVIEHAAVSMRVVCDRSTAQQLTRHRIGAYSMESQRYVNYKKRSESLGGYRVIKPPSLRSEEDDIGWRGNVENSLRYYEGWLDLGIKAEDARSVLPNCMATTLIATYNLRTWRHVIKMRGLNSHAQWQIRGLALDALKILNDRLPEIFGDLVDDGGRDG